MMHTIEVEIPEGFEPVGFRPAVLYEQYLINGDVRTCVLSSGTIQEVIIVQPTRRVPEYGEEYFYCNATLGVNIMTNDGSITDDKLFRIGNFFKTKEDCQAAARKVSELLLKLKKSS